MTIGFVAVTIHSRRRLRLAFSERLAAVAFSDLSTYTVTCEDGRGADPAVVAAFVVSGNLAMVELGLGLDLVDGARYSVAAIGVPAYGGGTTASDSVLVFRPGEKQQAPAAQSPSDDILADLYGVDLYFDGDDLVEDASGDLGVVSGLANVQGAIERAARCDGLLWAPTWGAHPRRFVDGSSLLVSSLVGDLTRQALRDDRVKSASAQAMPGDETHPEDTYIELSVRLIEGSAFTSIIPVKTT